MRHHFTSNLKNVLLKNKKNRRRSKLHTSRTKFMKKMKRHRPQLYQSPILLIKYQQRLEAVKKTARRQKQRSESSDYKNLGQFFLLNSS